jgi:hypothetical protein
MGNTISGRYFYDPNHPDGSADPNLGLYNNTTSPFFIGLETSSRFYSFLSSSNRITVLNQAVDVIDVMTLASVTSNLPTVTTLGQMIVTWNDPTATAISSEALVAPPQFDWDPQEIRLLAFDDGNGSQFGLFAEIDSFTASQNLVVTNADDDGPGSLRQTIFDARANGVPDVITFDPSVFPPAALTTLTRLPQ